MTADSVVYSEGSLHGLPSFPDESKLTNLTALVTGANGISGYHLVRVLAANPKRWSQIYCLSRRSPPDNFFEDLGEGATRVKHIPVDFLSEPAQIAERLKENVQKMSTGAKNYGFHMGPATNPSFESDPRVKLEDNFYYPQEDALAKYCEETGAAWNVVRPSYIIGAVRDGALNFMIGLAIYGAIQSYLKKPLDFPGDYAAWDREFCQSTALLNAHFEEWAVLTDKAANEAFNIQDGQSFTWGRFWPYLASWFGIPWNPPRGRFFKIQGDYMSTCGYSQRWSGKTEVQQAWIRLSEDYGLVLDPFDEQKRAQIFGMSDSALLGDWPLSLSMRKARKLGFFGTADSFETAFEAIQDLARLKLVIPTVMKEYSE
ncbi:hypothetical protein N7481_009910 [Penicillium waksmanii]|uniref:uncharacterized protein n=1 Tax=Penicillium waksmanii TaxID=69791 RepID=UPI002548FEB7|nr:uncharacterized protein N7481_009910 [Penicillium waksmanii]KAJ5976203.1 hypothetical protein N7481_009910 [Penicillium waksmanii]